MTARCRSFAVHAEPVDATVVGTFDASWMNGNPPEPGSRYCLRCAVMLHTSGMFTPTDGTTLPSIEEFLRQAEAQAAGAARADSGRNRSPR